MEDGCGEEHFRLDPVLGGPSIRIPFTKLFLSSQSLDSWFYLTISDELLS